MRAQVKIPQNEWKVKLKKYLRTRTNTKEGKIGKERAVQKDEHLHNRSLETGQRLWRRRKYHKIIQEHFLELHRSCFQKLKEPIEHNLFCYKACWENTNLFQHSLYDREQLEHNSYFTFCLCYVFKKYQLNTGNCTQLNQATWKKTNTHISSIYWLLRSRLLSYKIALLFFCKC